MKFSLPIRFSKKGIIIAYKGDKLTFLWPYFRHPMLSTSLFISENFNLAFSGWNAYQEAIAKKGAKNYKRLVGFDNSEIISQWASLKFPFEHVIILANINVQAKNIQFWAKVPQTDMQHFLKDFVVLRCKDVTQLMRLMENIPPNFAEAYGYSMGNLITYNKEEY